MPRVRQAAGGGRVVEVEPDRLVGWINRFAERGGGIRSLESSLGSVTIVTAQGAVATLAVPFAPMAIGGSEPVEALLAHVTGIGDMAAVLVRGGAHCIGVCRAGLVVASSTATRYLQGRTAAGGWSQQRYARRRENQRRDAHHAAADTAYRVLAPHAGSLRALIAAGEPGALRAVLDDKRLDFLTRLPRRTFTDIAEPRRAVLDEIARRSLAIEVTVRHPGGLITR